ncbi:CheR family methyltransferase [Sphingomicrobium lutaoense]|uniref:Two-component system CheB/CheR fusion protein n=1 Tax=Sphingomicrobium lutaoense TaxID=515949 RepID=A0A839YYZ7_9SPHN|nr:CheR family methyltransferase [Sphingomicrobium lutaoense]MBB3762997.1 two-component system CheB/CheR fusion protein [Sphingomicrobium lutaoense]
MATMDASLSDTMADKPTHTVPIVGVGASAGGLEALREMFGAANEETGIAFVIVQHLDPHHESMMAQLLARETRLEVHQAEGGETPRADHVYIIPPGHGLAMKDGKLELTEFSRPRGMRRPIDDFFESLANDHEHLAACVILSGTGADGSLGLRTIKEKGGLAVAQEPTSARYDGMPQSAVGTGLVDFVREPSEILETLVRYFHRRASHVRELEDSASVSAHLQDICSTLRDVVAHDFSGYKQSTLERRIQRRMQVLGLDHAGAYLDRLRRDHGECDALFRDLLINVTRFFRDREHFDQLRFEVIEPLIDNLDEAEELRIWVAGCSSGEEAYSLAMMVADACDERGVSPLVQIFATDIDEKMLNIAREGRYPPAATADMDERLAEKYLQGHGDHYSVIPRIRDMVRFSNHSVIKDAPFSRLHLVTCRNLLIYFGERLQQSVLPLFHYAIQEGGYLMLGPSETIGRHDNLFEPVDLKARIYRRCPGRGTYPTELHAASHQSLKRQAIARRTAMKAINAEDDNALKRLIERYGPAALVLGPDGAVNGSYGRLARYFEFPTTAHGPASAAGLARPGLREVLLPLLRQAQEDRSRVVARDVEVRSEFGSQRVNVIADPLPDGQTLLVLREIEAFHPEADDDLAELGPNDGEVQILEDELRLARHRLRSTVEELETVNEELKSSNEEMMSMNEELQSTNEELTTVNDELKSKVDQLTVANSDLKNFFESTRLAVVVLDKDLTIRSFTEAASEIFPLKTSDKGRSLEEMTSKFGNRRYLEDARAVIAGREHVERQFVTDDGATYLFRALPYTAAGGDISGATLVFTDVSEMTQLEAELARERERLSLALKVAGIGVWEYLADDDCVRFDDTMAGMYRLDGAGSYPFQEILDRVHPEDHSRFQNDLRRAISNEKDDYDITFRLLNPDGSEISLRSLGRLVTGSKPARLIGVSFDVTADAREDAMRELLLREMNHRVKNLFAIIGGMVSLAARHADTKDMMAQTLRSRIAALGRAHSLTNSGDDQDFGDIQALVGAALEPYADHEGMTIEGPSIAIRTEAISSLALLLHEWATNSVKYGALGDPDATMKIDWCEDDGGGIRLHWTEELSRERNSEEREGFGSTLVAASARQLGAVVEQQRDERGYRLTLILPKSCRMISDKRYSS